jgi:integration host factor subunit beta
MTRSQLVQVLCARHGLLAPEDTDRAVKAILRAMAQALASGNRIEIRGFGTFSLSYIGPRVSRNPKTGARVDVPPKCVPRFKPGVDLRAGVNDLPDQGDRSQAHRRR